MQHGSFLSPQQHLSCFPLMSLYHSLCIARIRSFYFSALTNTRLVSTFLTPPSSGLETSHCAHWHVQMNMHGICQFPFIPFHTSLKCITPTNAREQAVPSLSGWLHQLSSCSHRTSLAIALFNKYPCMCHNTGPAVDESVWWVEDTPLMTNTEVSSINCRGVCCTESLQYMFSHTECKWLELN